MDFFRLVTTSTESSSSAYRTTNENANFFKLARLILDICNDAMRDLMRSKISDDENKLTNRIASSQTDLENCRLFQSQKQIIFPANNGNVRYQTLDFSLMYFLVRNVFHEEIEPASKRNKRWGNCPTANDTSLLAAIETIRECRNKFFAHAVSSRINEKDFKELWTDIESAVDNINNHINKSISTVCYKKEMEKLKESSTDPDLEKILEKLFELEKQCSALSRMEGNYADLIIRYLKLVLLFTCIAKGESRSMSRVTQPVCPSICPSVPKSCHRNSSETTDPIFMKLGM